MMKNVRMILFLLLSLFVRCDKSEGGGVTQLVRPPRNPNSISSLSLVNKEISKVKKEIKQAKEEFYILKQFKDNLEKVNRNAAYVTDRVLGKISIAEETLGRFKI